MIDEAPKEIWIFPDDAPQFYYKVEPVGAVKYVAYESAKAPDDRAELLADMEAMRVALKIYAVPVRPVKEALTRAAKWLPEGGK